MQTEIEAKWLNVDKDELRDKLKKIGAKLVQPERLMVRSVYDFDDKSLEAKKGWVRVRDEADKVTLSYKQLNDRTLHGTKEVTVVVDDFKSTCELLEAIGMERRAYQETKRESWQLGDIEIELDTWPWIPSFVEIEAPDEKKLKTTAEKLDLDYAKALHGSVETAYTAVYDVTELEIDYWPEITFSNVPDWLEKKRKKYSNL